MKQGKDFSHTVKTEVNDVDDVVVSGHSGVMKFRLLLPLLFHPFIGVLQNAEGATTDCLSDIPRCTDFGMLNGLCLHFAECKTCLTTSKCGLSDPITFWSENVTLWTILIRITYPDIDRILIRGLNWVYMFVCVCVYSMCAHAFLNFLWYSVSACILCSPRLWCALPELKG